MSRIVRLLKDNIYQLVAFRDYEVILYQGTLAEIEAYIALEERGLIK